MQRVRSGKAPSFKHIQLIRKSQSILAMLIDGKVGSIHICA